MTIAKHLNAAISSGCDVLLSRPTNSVIDGFFAGPNGEIDWSIHDPEVDQAAHEMMQPGTLLLGRVTYQMFESY